MVLKVIASLIILACVYNACEARCLSLKKAMWEEENTFSKLKALKTDCPSEEVMNDGYEPNSFSTTVVKKLKPVEDVYQYGNLNSEASPGSFEQLETKVQIAVKANNKRRIHESRRINNFQDFSSENYRENHISKQKY